MSSFIIFIILVELFCHRIQMRSIQDDIDELKQLIGELEENRLNQDEVIDWLDNNICNAYDYDGNEISTTLKSKFKEDFGL